MPRYYKSVANAHLTPTVLQIYENVTFLKLPTNYISMISERQLLLQKKHSAKRVMTLKISH